MNKDLVSVIVCAYNSEAFIADAIESVLQQDYPQTELIVVDDGSRDKSAEIANCYPQVKLITHPENKGLTVGRNTGIAASIGEYIAFLDADDMWVPTKLSTQVEFHRKNPQFKYSYTLERFIYEEFAERPNWTKKKVFQEDHAAYVPSSMLFQRSLFKRVGLFNPAYSNGEATEWIFRAKDKGYFGGVVQKVLLLRRIHTNNLSSNVDKEVNALLQVVKTSIRRQKKVKDPNE